jgi:hypothetical protein
MKPLQYFNDAYLVQCKDAHPEAILDYLESFRLLQLPSPKTKLISMKVPETLLAGFRRKCELHNIRYQTQIKKLMQAWLQDIS